MSAQDFERNRLKLQIENTIKELNQQVINPVFPELKLSDLEPILTLVARARADYLKELFKVTLASGTGLPEAEQVDSLEEHRTRYEELLKASQALEHAIERGYLDVTS